MVRWFLNNLGLIVLALAFAFATWMLSTLQEDPIIEQALPARVVRLGEGQLGDRVILNVLPAVVTATLRGPRSLFEALQPADLRVDLDVGSLPVGEHVLPLTPTLSNSSLAIIASRPATTAVVIDRLLQVQLPVRASIIGSPALGFRAGQPSITPQQVIVTASQQVISKVAAANVTVSVDGARSSVSQDARVYARTAEGELVPSVTVVPDQATVRVPMEQLSNYRDLPVVVKWRGQPAEGYAVTDISAEPLIVTVFGSVDAVQATKGYIETMEVLINDARSDIDERVGLNVPPGVSLVSENQSARVRIRIQPLLGSRTVKRKPILIGVSEHLTTTVSPELVDIVLNGPLPRLNTLTADDVRVLVDVSGLQAGVTQLTPRVITPDGITAQSVVPATVQVELTEAR
jgi:YbbR domain-containing protein